VSGLGWALFDTAVGRCAVAWGEAGVAGVQLPEASDGAARARLRRRFAGGAEAAPPPDVGGAIAAITALLGGQPADLRSIALDLRCVPDFDRRVYEAARDIPPGETRTYGEVARLAGHPGAARAVGAALARNPFPIVVPCHRVVAAGGGAGGFSARGGVATKIRLLAIERAWAGGAPELFRGRPAGRAAPARGFRRAARVLE